MLVVNLWGAPSSGKSTTAAGLFFLLKINKWRVELVTEYAKELVWDGRENIFETNQLLILGEQTQRLLRLQQQGVDVVITDSPLPLSLFYAPDTYFPSFTSLAIEQFNAFNNINFLLTREHSFEAMGRRHNEHEAVVLAKKLELFLATHDIDYESVLANPKTPTTIFNKLLALRAPLVTDLPIVNIENQ